ncbi:MAG: AAA family ATPase [Nocardioidaceae bacterium]
MTITTTASATAATARAVLDEVEHVIVGKREALETMLLGILSGGHVLIEDLPGLGKTLMARSFAQALGLEFTRVQFTPDLLPSDLTGAAIFDQRSGDLAFRPGPVFTNLLLADEINRTPPKTQAALLEAMSEAQVSVDGVTRPLPSPFIVLATDNPIEYEGTYPLPEAQLDRFTMRLHIGYLDRELEGDLIRHRLARAAATDPPLNAVVEADGLLAMIASLEQVEVSDDIVDYIVRVVRSTRDHADVLLGASPRGALALTQLARGRALLDGREFVTPADVKRLAVPALGHRIGVRPELWVRRITGDDIVREVLDRVPTPATQPHPDVP